MNVSLLCSSIICAIVHCIYYEYIDIVEWLGITTSIMNHASTNDIVKYLDRIIMIVGFLYKINNPIVWIAMLLYFVSKHTHVALHVLSHIVITIVNIT